MARWIHRITTSSKLTFGATVADGAKAEADAKAQATMDAVNFMVNVRALLSTLLDAEDLSMSNEPPRERRGTSMTYVGWY